MIKINKQFSDVKTFASMTEACLDAVETAVMSKQLTQQEKTRLVRRLFYLVEIAE